MGLHEEHMMGRKRIELSVSRTVCAAVAKEDP